jgi:DNA repair protein RecO (recombination protein O)
MIAKDEAVILRVRDYSENSQLVTCFTRAAGKIKLLAKGIKRSGKNRPGRFLEPLARGEVTFYRRRQGGLFPLSEWTAGVGLRALRDDLGRMYAGLYCAELVDALTVFEDPSQFLFDLLVDTLGRLQEGAESVRLIVRFQARVLDVTGHRPKLEACTRCGKSAQEGEIVFDVREGGVVCSVCSAVGSAARHGRRPGAGRAPRLNVSDLAACSALAGASSTVADRVVLSSRGLSALQGLFDTHLAYLLGKELRVRRYL